jgi:hypothetical protein
VLANDAIIAVYAEREAPGNADALALGLMCGIVVSSRGG